MFTALSCNTDVAAGQPGAYTRGTIRPPSRVHIFPCEVNSSPQCRVSSVVSFGSANPQMLAFLTSTIYSETVLPFLLFPSLAVLGIKYIWPILIVTPYGSSISSQC